MIEGEQGNMFFILMAGKVNMVRQNVTTKTVDANEQPGQFFGERKERPFAACPGMPCANAKISWSLFA